MATQGHKDKKKTSTWPEKAKQRGKAIKHLRKELKRAKAGRVRWRDKYFRLKSASKGTKVAGHRHKLELMCLGVILHISYNVSLRATAKSICSMAQAYGQEMQSVSATTIRNWCLRVSLYYLTRPISAGEYILIADESIAMGRERLLVLLLVRVDEQSRICPLQLSDVSVLHLEARSTWGGAEISSIIRQKTAAQGLKIRYAVSDQGTNLKNAFGLSKITWVGDCTHALSSCTKRLYKKDEIFNSFIKKMNETRAKWSLSEQALYLPPTLRNKARFHQMFVVYKWAEMILINWDNLSQKVKDELVYVQQGKELVQNLKQIHILIEAFSAIFKSKGVSTHTQETWLALSDKIMEQFAAEGKGVDPKTQKYLQVMNDYVANLIAEFGDECQILCCSDVIESIFGKYKNKGGCKIITDDALNIASYPEKITKEDVLLAMGTKHIKSILEWKHENTTRSMLKQKRELLKKMAA